MKEKKKIIIIGNYMEKIEIYLRHRGFVCNELINSCNPLAMVGLKNENFLTYCKDINFMPAILNLRKNLNQMLSVDEENYCHNYNILPLGKNCEYSNTAEYIVISNSGIAYELYSDGKYLYSDIWPQNDFTKMLKSDKNYKKILFPFDGMFNWKSYYDKFINEITAAYDKEHIIFVRTNSAQWYFNNTDITAFEKKSALYRNQIQEIDDYFIEKTHCIVIDESYNHIPFVRGRGALIYSMMSRFSYECIAKKIEEILSDASAVSSSPIKGNNVLAKCLQIRLARNVIDENVSDINYIEENAVTYQQFDHYYGHLKLFAMLHKIKIFLNPDKNYTLSDYIVNLLSSSVENVEAHIDFEIINNYTKMIKLDINDIIALYMLGKECGDKSKIRFVVKNILENESAMPIIAAKKFREKNIEYLTNYKYLSTNLKDFGEFEKAYIRLERNIYLILDPSSEDLIVMSYGNEADDYDNISIIEDGYACNIYQASALCADLAFYIERAKRNDGNRPVRLVFETKDKFYESLNYVDYMDLLENEYFIIELANEKLDTNEYKSRCDLSFMFDKKTKICILHSGFSDQLCYYIFAKQLEKYSGAEIYYDDLIYYNTVIFNGEEIHKIAKENLSNRLLSNILTPKLLENYEQVHLAPDKLIENGLTSMLIIGTDINRTNEIKKGNKIHFMNNPPELLENVLKYECNLSPTYYYCMIRPEWLINLNYFELKEYIHFPQMQDKNKMIEEKMLTCDAVVIHIRRGDFVAWGWEADNDFYIEAIKKIIAITEYVNKKYFLFSDDIPWVKKHSNEIGLNLVGNDEIIYVDHNKNDTSYIDMYLMSLGKIIIGSGSGFVRMAALYSSRCEDFICFNIAVMETFEKIGRKNKHDLGAFSKRYGIDYSSKTPKKQEVIQKTAVNSTGGG